MSSSMEVGSGHFAVIPSFKGFRRAVDREAQGAGASGARGFSQAMGKGGDVAGGLAGRGFSRGFQKSSSVKSALAGVQREVRTAAAGVAKARLVESDAAGKVRVAESQLAEARSKHAAGSSQVVRAEERLASTQRGHIATQGRLQESMGRLTQAQKTLASAQAGSSAGGGFWASMRGHVSKARSDLQSLSTSQAAFGRASAGGFAEATSGVSRFQGALARGAGGFRAVASAGVGMGRTIMGAVGPVGGQIAGSLGRGFTAAVGAAGRAASSIGQSFQGVLGGAVTAGVAGLVGALKGGFDRLASVETATAKMRGFGLEASTVTGVMAQVKDSVQGTVYSVGEMGNAAAAAVLAGVKPGQELDKYMGLVKNTATAAGAPLNEIQSIFGKIVSNVGGPVTTELNQLTDRGIPAWSILSEKMGLSVTELKSMASEGRITSDVIVKHLGGAMSSMAEEVGGTTVSSLQRMRSSFSRFGEALMATSFPGIKAGADAVKAVMDAAIALVQPLQEAFGLDSATDGISKIESFTEKVNKFTEMIKGGGADGESAIAGIVAKIKELAPIIGLAAAAAIPLMGAFLSSLPIIGGLFAGLGPGLLAGLAPVLAGGGLIAMLAIDPAAFSGMVGGLVTSLVSGMQGLVSSVSSVLATLVPTIVANLAGNAPILADGIVMLLSGLGAMVGQLIPTLVTAVSTLIPALVTALVTAIPALITGGIALLMGVVSGLVSAIPTLVTAITTAIPTLVSALVRAIPQLMAGGLKLFLGLIQGLAKALPQILTSVISMVPVLITGLVSQIPSLIQGAISLFLGIINGLAQAIPAILTAVIAAVPQLVSALVSALPQLIVGAVQLFLGIVSGLAQAIPAILTAVVGMIPQIVSSIVGAVPQLLQAGADLIAGLARGIAGSASAVMDAIGNVVNGAVDWAKNLLGIKSPSRVFKKIGDFLGQGFAVGVLKSADKVKSATGKLIDLVKDQFDKLDDLRAASRKREKALEDKRAGEKVAAGKKVATLENKLLNLDAQRSAAQRRLDSAKTDDARAKAKADLERISRNRKIAETDLKSQKAIAKNGKEATRQQIRDERADGRALDAARKKGSKALVASIKAQEKAMATAAAAREKLAGRLADARDALSEAIKVRDDWAANIQGSVSKLGALAGRASVDSMTGNLRAQIESAKEFQKLMNQLMKDGLDKASVEELTAAFAQDGSLATVRALAAGGKGAVSEVVGLRKELDKVAVGIGKSTGSNLYQAGVDSAQGLVKGLESQAKALEAAGKKLSDALVKSVKKALGIKSPSRRFRDQVGKMVPLGVLDGMTDRSIGRRLDRASADLVPVPEPAAAMRRYASAQARRQAVDARAGRSGDSVSVVVEGDATPETAVEIARRTRLELKRRKVVV